MQEIMLISETVTNSRFVRLLAHTTARRCHAVTGKKRMSASADVAMGNAVIKPLFTSLTLPLTLLLILTPSLTLILTVLYR